MELLELTDAAVKALNRSSRSQSSASSEASVRSKVSLSKEDSGIRTLTPLVETKSPMAVPRETNNENNNGLRSSDDSTTASDVLIRSTIADRENSLLELNASNISKSSKTSLGVSNHNDTSSRKVKISSELLREIPSPLNFNQSGNLDMSSNELIPPALCNMQDPTLRMVSGNTCGHLVSGQKIHPRVDVVSRRKNTANPNSREEVTSSYYIERHTPQKRDKHEYSSCNNGVKSDARVKQAGIGLNKSLDLIPQKEGIIKVLLLRNMQSMDY